MQTNINLCIFSVNIYTGEHSILCLKDGKIPYSLLANAETQPYNIVRTLFENLVDVKNSEHWVRISLADVYITTDGLSILYGALIPENVRPIGDAKWVKLNDISNQDVLVAARKIAEKI